MLAWPNQFGDVTSLEKPEFFSSLDQTYDDLVWSMELLPHQMLTLAHLCNPLLDEEQRKVDNKLMRGKNANTSLPAASVSSESDSMPGVLTVKRCCKCNSDEHLLRSCPSRDSGPVAKRGQRWRRGTGRAQVQMDNAAQENCQQSWAIDSSANHHVSKDKGLFLSLEPVTVLSVNLANGLCASIAVQGRVHVSVST